MIDKLMDFFFEAFMFATWLLIMAMIATGILLMVKLFLLMLGV